MKRYVVAFLLAMATGCAPISSAVVSNKPEVIEVSSDSNPDVIWIVRDVEIEDRDNPNNPNVKRYGLFACYRQPASNPGAPVCYLAMTSWDLKQLMWPGLLYIKDGKLVSK